MYYYYSGLLYTYLAGHVGPSSSSEGAFRALKHGYVHWASGHVEEIEVNTNNPLYCHVRSTIKPSMKSGTYKIYLLLKIDQSCTISEATHECAAGLATSGNRVYM